MTITLGDRLNVKQKDEVDFHVLVTQNSQRSVYHRGKASLVNLSPASYTCLTLRQRS